MKRCLGAFISIVLLIGCTTFHGLKPITPKREDKTTNLRPTFEWNPSENENVKYDFVVYDLVMKRTRGLNYVPVGGDTVYYREALGQCKHTLEEDLEPGKEYLWSVRVREGDRVGPWSLYDFNAYFVFGYIIQRNHMFRLKIVDPRAPIKPIEEN